MCNGVVKLLSRGYAEARYRRGGTPNVPARHHMTVLMADGELPGNNITCLQEGDDSPFVGSQLLLVVAAMKHKEFQACP